MSGESPPATAGTPSSQYRTLAVRISEDLRAQLDIIAQLTGRSTTRGDPTRHRALDRQTKNDPGRSRRRSQCGRNRARSSNAPKRYRRHLQRDGKPGANAPTTRSTSAGKHSCVGADRTRDSGGQHATVRPGSQPTAARITRFVVVAPCRPAGEQSAHEEGDPDAHGIVFPLDEQEPLSAREFASLAEYQATVGGYVEAIALGTTGLSFFAHEEAKLVGQQLIDARPSTGGSTCLRRDTST